MTWIIAQLLAGWYVADFGTAWVHYALDHGQRWVNVPFLGSLVRDFEEHHRDPSIFVRRGFCESSWMPVLVGVAMLPGMLLLPWLFGSLCAGTAFCQQIHKWSHVRAAWPIRAMQKIGVFIRPTDHGAHHSAPHERTFGVLNAWSDVPLNWVFDAMYRRRLRREAAR